MPTAYEVVRYAILAMLVAAAFVAVGSWAVTSRRISPFSAMARTIRRLTDPVLRPVERFLLARGGNPQHAPWWLLGLVIVLGIVALTLSQWLLSTAARLVGAAQTGPRGVVRLVIYFAGQVLSIALIVRVVASWMGPGRHNRWLRPAYVLTDWLVEPLRRIVPPLGVIDITPVIAWFLVQLVLAIVLQAI